MAEGKNYKKIHEQEIVYPMDVRIEKRFYSVYELKRRYDQGRKIVLNSDFQRNDVWKETQKIELIESVLMGLPIPVFYFNEDKYGRLIVIDGRQRLTALFEFLDNKFPLKDVKILPDLKGKRFSELDIIEQGKLEDYQIQANVIQPPTPDRIMFDIFERVNRTGTRLTEQEIRNALYQGPATSLLNRLEKTEEFKNATGDGLVSDTRMKGKYFLNRFLAFYLYYNRRLPDNKTGKEYSYRGDADELFGITLETINEMTEWEREELETVTMEALKNSSYYLGPDAFRKQGGEKRTPVNMNVFETVMYAMTLVPQRREKWKQPVSQYIAKMVTSDKFLDSIGNHRDGAKKVDDRFEMARGVRKVLDI